MPSLESEIGCAEDNPLIHGIGFEHPFSSPDHEAPGGLEQDLENSFDGIPAPHNADSPHPNPESPNQDSSPFQIEPDDVETMSLLMPNEEDPPVLQVLLNQALPLEATTNNMLRSNTLKVVHRVHDPQEIKQLLEALQTPGVTDNNGMNAQSSRQHILIEVRTAVGKLVLSLIDLCGDETSDTPSGPLGVGSTAIAVDLGALRVLVTQKLYGKFKAVEIPGNGRGCEPTRRFVARLPHFRKVNFLFVCDGLGSVQSVRNLCGEWVVGEEEQAKGRS